MSDGVILKNIGFGWKLHGKVKPGISVQDYFLQKQATQAEVMAKRPALAAYRKCLHSMAGMDKRWKLEQCLGMLSNDPDGVWSECCDGYGDNVHADIDEVGELCRLYEAAVIESKSLKEVVPE